MPIYNFKCNDCEREFDITVSCYDLIPKDLFCPECRGKNVRKKFNRVSLIFKGKDFYSTTNRKEEKVENNT